MGHRTGRYNVMEQTQVNFLFDGDDALGPFHQTKARSNLLHEQPTRHFNARGPATAPIHSFSVDILCKRKYTGNDSRRPTEVCNHGVGTMERDQAKRAEAEYVVRRTRWWMHF